MTELHNTNKLSATFESLSDFAPDWVVSPGDVISDILQEKGWTKAELAQRTGFSSKHVNQLLKGDASITQETAVKLEKVLGSTVRFWLGLEVQYRELLGKQEDGIELAADSDWLKELPLRDMIKFGWVSKLPSKASMVHECLKYYAVSSVDAWRAQYQNPVAAYRAAPKLRRTPAAVSAWLRQGERLAEAVRCVDYNKAKFESALTQVRALTVESDATKFLPRLELLCAQAGVAVVVAPAPTGCPVSGATKWLSPHKGLIVLSLRGKSDDKLWFTFFHEAAHLLKHGKSLTFLDILGEDGLNPVEEAEADSYARNFLLPSIAYETFARQGRFSRSSVCTFAGQQGVSPGIVVGRLQFDRRLPWTHLNSLKATYQWAHKQGE